MKFYIFIFILTTINSAISLDYITEKPDYLTSCSIRDSNFIPCSTNTMQQLFHQMAQGIPGLKSLPKIDPYYIKKVKLVQNNDAATLAVEMKNVIIKGLGDAHIKENVVDQKDYSWTTKSFIPKLRIDGDYKMDGRLLLLTLKGEGKFFIEMENIDLDMYTKVQLYEKGDLTFGNATDVKAEFKVSNAKLKLDNLFNGAADIENSLNNILNENWRDFLEALRPALSQTVERILLDNLQKIFHYIPAKYFISDIPTSQQLYG